MNETKYIDEIIVLTSGNITLVEKIEYKNVDGVIISTAYSRRTIKVGDNLAMEDPRVQAIASVVHSESYLGIPVIPTDNSNWDGFNAQMMTDTRFNQVYNQCLSVSPIIANALPVALDQVTTKGYTLFESIWGQVCTLGGATAEDKLVWKGYAENNNLSQEFCKILVRM